MSQEEIRKEFDKYLTQILSSAATEYTIQSETDVLTIQKFFLFRDQQNSVVNNCWRVEKNDHTFYIYAVHIDSTLAVYKTKETQTHVFLYGYLKTHNDFGKSLIRPETIQDKIADMFGQIELDFSEHTRFSSKYYCLSENPLKLKGAISYGLMDYLVALDDLTLEFSDYSCSFRTQKSIIAIEESLELFDIGYKLAVLLS